MNTEVNECYVIMFAVDNFGEWLLSKLAELKISQSELARRSGLSKGTISNLINGTKGTGQESLTAIAHALRLPASMVFEKAGILPPNPEADPLLEQIDYLYSTLKDPANKQRALDYMELLLRQENKGNMNETNAKTQPR